MVKGPSEKVGIMAGDRIISVNDTAIAGVKMDQSEIMRRLRGKRGTMVRLGVVRRGIAEVLYFDVKRDKIPLNTIDAAYMIRPQVGYIRIGSFGAYTYKEFMDAVKKLNKEGMKNLILDLQENGGGYMLSATQIVNEFLGKNDLIVYTDTLGRPQTGRVNALPGDTIYQPHDGILPPRVLRAGETLVAREQVVGRVWAVTFSIIPDAPFYRCLDPRRFFVRIR